MEDKERRAERYTHTRKGTSNKYCEVCAHCLKYVDMLTTINGHTVDLSLQKQGEGAPYCAKIRVDEYLNVSCWCCYCSRNNGAHPGKPRKPKSLPKPQFSYLSDRVADHWPMKQSQLEEILKVQLQPYLSPELPEEEKYEDGEREWIVIFHDEAHISGDASDMAATRLANKCDRNKIPYVVIQSTELGGREFACNCRNSVSQRYHKSSQRKSEARNLDSVVQDHPLTRRPNDF